MDEMLHEILVDSGFGVSIMGGDYYEMILKIAAGSVSFEHGNKTLMTFLYTGWFIAVLILASSNPDISG